MTNSKTTKRALFSSVMALLLCFTMLLGTTFAWFTDTAATGINKIQAGNLDLEVYYAFPSDVVNGDIPEGNWKRMSEDKSVFNENALWEPGYTEVVFFKFDNVGSLAFQYQFNVDIIKEVIGQTAKGEDIQLSEHIQAYINNTFDYNYRQFLATERDDATAPAGAPNPYYTTLYEAATMAPCRADNYTENALSLDSWQWLEPDETTYATLVLWMPTIVGNEANHDGTHKPSIDLGINVVATQYTYESDSFDNQYDKDATIPTVVANNEELQNAINAGKSNIMLLDGQYTAELYNATPNKNLTITGQGADTKLSFSNLQVRLDLFDSLTISNCTIERMPNKAWGHIVFGSSTQAGGIYTLSNCTFNGVGSQGIYINQNVEATFNINNCTFNGDFGGEGAITIQNNNNVNITVNVNNCNFNSIPTTSHEIYILYAYEGWTLNADGVTAFWKTK